MDKKKALTHTITGFLIIAFLSFFGSGVIISPFYGEINFIDEGQFGGWIAHMLKGEHLYEDIYAAYGPLYIYPFYLLSKLFGPSVFLIRIVLIVFNVFLAVFIAWGIIRKLRLAWYFQLFTLAMLLIVPGYTMRQGTGLLTILLYVYALEKRAVGWNFLPGMTLAISYLISTEIGIFTSIIILLFVFYQFVVAKNIFDVFKRSLVMFIGLSIVFFLFYWWSASEGWFWPYISTISDDLRTYSSIDLPNGMNFPNPLVLYPRSFFFLPWVKFLVSKEMLLYWLFLFYIIFFFYLLAAIILRRKQKNTPLIFAISLFGFLLSMILVGRSGHFPFTLSPLFILFAYFLDLLVKKWKKTQSYGEKITSTVLVTLILLFSLRILLIYRPHFIKLLDVPQAVLSKKNNPSYIGNVFISSSQKKDIQTMQNFVWTNTKPTDTIFFLGNEPMMYLLVNRDNPSRFDLPEVANTLEKRLELLNALQKDKTEYIIYDTKSWDVDGVSNMQRLPEVMKYIRSSYEERTLGSYIIYYRKN